MAIPSGSNLTKFITREVRVGHGDYRAMVLSAFSYKISTYGGAGASGRCFNEFCESAVQFYGPHDTVAIQTFAYPLSSKQKKNGVSICESCRK